MEEEEGERKRRVGGRGGGEEEEVTHTQTLTVHAARVIDVEAADDVTDHDNGSTAVGDCHVQDARGKMEVWVLTLEDGDILGPALSATLKREGGEGEGKEEEEKGGGGGGGGGGGEGKEEQEEERRRRRRREEEEEEGT